MTAAETLLLTFSHLDSGPTEVHNRGCRAAARSPRSHGPVETVDHEFTEADLVEMLTNPDEGHLHLHGCLGLVGDRLRVVQAEAQEAFA